MIFRVIGTIAGVGAEMARKFTKNGHRVIATGHCKDRLDQLAVELGTAVLPIVMDVTDKHSINSALASLPSAWKEIDLLINNASLALSTESAQRASLEE